MRTLCPAVLSLLGTAVAAALAGPAAAQTCIQEIAIPGGTPGMVRRDIAVAPSGKVYYTELESNEIGEYDPVSGLFQTFAIPTANSGPHSLDADSQGIIWFSESDGHQIGSLDPTTGSFVEYATTLPNSMPYGIAIDGLDNIWWTERNTTQVSVRLASTGQIIDFPFDPLQDGPTNLEIDNRNRLVWVTMINEGRLASLDPFSGTITRYDIPGPGASRPHSCDIDDQGMVWFSDVAIDRIGRLDPATGNFTFFPLPTAGALTHGIIVGVRGLVWFVEINTDKVGVFFPNTGQFLETSTSPGGEPYFLTQAPNREIWVSEVTLPNIARLPCTKQ